MFNLLICRTPTFTTRQLRNIAYCYCKINAQLYDIKDRSNHMFVKYSTTWMVPNLFYLWLKSLSKLTKNEVIKLGTKLYWVQNSMNEEKPFPTFLIYSMIAKMQFSLLVVKMPIKSWRWRESKKWIAIGNFAQ